MAQRLRSILARVSDYVTKTRISLVNVMSKYENAGGLVQYDQFITVLKN